MREISKQSTVVRTKRGLSVCGTRITLYDIMDYLKADWPPSLIREWLNLTPHQIADVMVYISAHRDEIEAEYQEVLNQAKKNRDFWEERNRDRLSRISRFPEKPGQEAAIAKLRSRSSELRPS